MYCRTLTWRRRLVVLYDPNLEAEADPQHEAGHAGDKAAKEGIEGEGPHQAAVHKLHTRSSRYTP